MSGFAEDYVDVATRIGIFREKYPEGSLQPFNPSDPVKIVALGDKAFIQYVACAYRTPGDERPGIGVAWEPFPGKTPYTRDSEAMVAETSAWGRAIVAVLAADTKRGIASADEVRNRRSPDYNEPPVDPAVAELNDAKAEVRAAWEATRGPFHVAAVEMHYNSDHDAALGDATAADLLAFAQDLRSDEQNQEAPS